MISTHPWPRLPRKTTHPRQISTSADHSHARPRRPERRRRWSPTEEIGWSRTQEIRGSPSQEIGWVPSEEILQTTLAYRIRGQTAYAIEGSIFVAGAAIKWLRDRLVLIKTAEETAELAATVTADHGVYFVPAFVGLGAPHWRSDARAAILGMTLDTGPAHIARAALVAVAYQTCDLIDTMARDGIRRPSLIRIDGGMARNDWFAQFLADMLGVTIERPGCHEATARGAAILAGIGAAVWPDTFLASEGSLRAVRFEPNATDAFRSRRLDGWHTAVRQVLSQ